MQTEGEITVGPGPSVFRDSQALRDYVARDPDAPRGQGAPAPFQYDNLPLLLKEPLDAAFKANEVASGQRPMSDFSAVDGLALAGGATAGSIGVARPTNALGTFAGRRARTRERYYPSSGLNPIHAVNDWDYVANLIRAARRNENINPILYEGLENNGNLLAGTHRLAANEILERYGQRGKQISKVEINDVVNSPADYGLSRAQAEQLMAAARDGDFETIDIIWDQRKPE
jgi:hypothetical protein